MACGAQRPGGPQPACVHNHQRACTTTFLEVLRAEISVRSQEQQRSQCAARSSQEPPKRATGASRRAPQEELPYTLFFTSGLKLLCLPPPKQKRIMTKEPISFETSRAGGSRLQAPPLAHTSTRTRTRMHKCLHAHQPT